MSRLQLIKNKMNNLVDAKRTVGRWQAKGEKVVFTNGCFDILHKGHLSYLAEAASLGDRMIIAVNSDDSVKRLGKDTNRPINAEEDRLFLLAGLIIVDAAVIFDENTPEQIIKELKPDILVKGGDYDATISDKSDSKYIVGRDFILENGGEVITIPTVEGYSTTNTIHKINA
jgi:rfaE bifunctional protein nucleotidyltransferase chain/domain